MVLGAEADEQLARPIRRRGGRLVEEEDIQPIGERLDADRARAGQDGLHLVARHAQPQIVDAVRGQLDEASQARPRLAGGEAFLTLAAIQLRGGLDARRQGGRPRLSSASSSGDLLIKRQTQFQAGRVVLPGEDELTAAGRFLASKRDGP